jgi:hypothetical protein
VLANGSPSLPCHFTSFVDVQFICPFLSPCLIGPLYLGAEVQHAPKLNMIQRALVNTCLNIVKRLNNGFHFSLGLDERGNLPDEKSIMEGTYEKAHLAFAIESSMDVIIASKPGTTLPKLGEPLYESDESVKHRRSKCRGSVDWNTEDTYTMAFWSCYVDWMLVRLAFSFVFDNYDS